eukprot:jgi/Chlat1/1780/Chrsp134S02120
MGSSARDGIAWVCAAAEAAGVSAALTPELLRLAKFDNPDACGQLWHALHDVIALELAQWPDHKTARQRLEALWAELNAEAATEDVPDFVKHYLGVWGYPRAAILLALGWLFSRTNLLGKALPQQQQQTSNEARAQGNAGGMLPPYPEDMYESTEALKAAGAAASAAAAYVRDAQRLGSHARHTEKAGLRMHAAQMLKGRVQVKSQQLSMLLACRLRRLHAISAMQTQLHEEYAPRSRSAASFLTPYELHLLTNPPLLKAHITALEQVQGGQVSAAEGTQHMEVFWRWMESALDEQLAAEVSLRGGDAECKAHDPRAQLEYDESASVSQLAADLDSVIAAVTAELQYRKKEASAVVASSRNAQQDASASGGPSLEAFYQNALLNANPQELLSSLQDELPEDIRRVLPRDDIRKQEEPHSSGHSNRSDAYGSFAAGENKSAPSRSAIEEVQSLAAVAKEGAKMLARTRAANKHALRVAMEPVLNNEELLVIGL